MFILQCSERISASYILTVHVGHKSLKMSPLKDIINALHKAGFADAEWELLGMQLNVPQTQLDNIR